MVKKSLEYDFQTTLHSIARLFTEFRHDASEIVEIGPKIRKKICADSVFPVFVSGHFIPLVSRLGHSDPSML